MKTKYERLRKTREQLAHRRLAKKQMMTEVSDYLYGSYWPPDEDDLYVNSGHWLWWDEYNDLYGKEPLNEFDDWWCCPIDGDGDEFEEDCYGRDEFDKDSYDPYDCWNDLV